MLQEPKSESLVSFEDAQAASTIAATTIDRRKQSMIYTSSDSGSPEKSMANDILSSILYVISCLLALVTFPFSLFFCLKVVKEYERAVCFRLGSLIDGGLKGPGLVWVLPCIESYQMIDLRVISFNVPPQEILSKDSVTVSVDAVVYFRVNNPVVSVTNVNDAFYSTKLLAQATLRNILGMHTLGEMLSDRDIIAQSIEKVLEEATNDWGVKVERVEMKDVRLPQSLMRAMAAEAEATREARAHIITAEGEHQASRALKDAADVIINSPAALQLRYLQSISSIAAEHNSTIIFPLPMDMTAIWDAGL